MTLTHRRRPRSQPRRLQIGTGIAILLMVALLPSGDRVPAESGTALATVTYVGGQACGACHPRELALWQASDHALAMQLANHTTVLGDFDHATFEKDGVTSTFFKRDGEYLVRTDGPDGQLDEYKIAYTFGVDPLQQYLIAFPNGRYQALSIAWIRAPPRSEANAGFISILTERSITATSFTGPVRCRTGTSCAPIATRPTSKKTIGLRRIVSRPPGQTSTSPVKPATAPVPVMWSGPSKCNTAAPSLIPRSGWSAHSRARPAVPGHSRLDRLSRGAPHRRHPV
jgi:hypothetical protein